tara:strand:+ start:321 stop:1499 length:1179 start_codon:yes stop_codon:yes gene_type:complete
MRNKIILGVLIFSLISRIIFSIMYGDQKMDHEWGVIVNNYFETNIFGFFKFNGVVTSNLYMPPLYAFFLIFLKFLFGELVVILNITYVIQSLISVCSSYYLFRIINKFYSYNVSLLMMIAYTFFPLNFYATSQISSIIFQSSFFIFFLYYIISFLQNENIKYIFYASFFSGLLILLRGEFLVTFIIFFILIIYKHRIKFVLIYLLIPLLIISPYLVRNYKIFDTITITKSFGYNLWKGNNELAKVEGNPGIFSNKIKSDLAKIEDLKKHDLIRDELFKKYAIENLKEEPLKFFKLYIEKVYSFLILDLDSSYPNYYNLLHVIPKILIFVFTLLGIIYYDKKNFYLNLFLFLFILNVLLFSIFFILPRYNLAILPLQILFVSAFTEKLFRKNK